MFQPREPKDLMKISMHESAKADMRAIPRIGFFIWWEHWAASGVYSGRINLALTTICMHRWLDQFHGSGEIHKERSDCHSFGKFEGINSSYIQLMEGMSH